MLAEKQKSKVTIVFFGLRTPLLLKGGNSPCLFTKRWVELANEISAFRFFSEWVSTSYFFDVHYFSRREMSLFLCLGKGEYSFTKLFSLALVNMKEVYIYSLSAPLAGEARILF